MEKIQRAALLTAFLVCPLIFFTNLTRNPYITQICLLNLALAAAGACLLWSAPAEGGLRLPKTAVDAPLAAWIGVCALSWAVAYLGHVAFFQPSMRAEGLRGAVFLLVNSLVPFYLGAALARRNDGAPSSPAWAWAAATLAWAGLWLLFPQLRSRPAHASSIWGNFWDPYGAFLWALGLAGAWRLCREAKAADFLHLALAAGFLASVYGILQYFNIEFFWPNVLNPYGGRSVSTFGNPNFMSSYNVVLLPAAAVLFLLSATRGERLIYGTVFAALQAALLCSMTRSSWAGGALAVGSIFLSPEIRRRAREIPQAFGLFSAAAVGIVLLWPQSSIGTSYAPSVVGRLAEVKEVVGGPTHYGPFHQRLLIWTSAWLMGDENPITGKGWGLFELFYPYYQGHILNHEKFYWHMRTHANNSHNEIMETWAQTGLLGLGVFLWLWGSFFAAARRHWTGGPLPAKALGLACAAGALGMLVDNLLNVSLHFAVPGFIFWWAAGVAMSAPAQQDGRWRRLPASIPRGAVAAAGTLVLALSAWYWVRAWNREAHYFAGFKLLRQGALPAATRHLELSRAWGPREVNAIYELGNAYARAERMEDAVRAYGQALSANAGYDEIFFNIGTLLATRLGRVEPSLPYFMTAWWINPVSQDLYNNLSAIFLQAPDRYRDPAIRLLERACFFYPKNPSHWNNLGYLYGQAGRHAQAEEAFAKALELSPEMIVAERNLRSSLERSRRAPPKILAALDNLRRVDSALGRGDLSGATLALAERASADFPDHPRVMFYHGSLLLSNKRPAEAAALLEKVVAREPRHAGAWINLGSAYAALGRTQDAISALRQAEEASPEAGDPAIQQRLRALGAMK